MKTKIAIEGMSCMHCHKTVTEALNGISGVESTEVNLEDKTAIIESDISVDKALITSVITNAGFTVGEIRAI